VQFPDSAPVGFENLTASGDDYLLLAREIRDTSIWTFVKFMALRYKAASRPD
jgi:hypothetical protein